MQEIMMIQNLSEYKKFRNDVAFNEVESRFISMPKERVKRNNYFLQKAMDIIIDRMKLVDSLFEKTYSRIIYCGSFYKGTKIITPEEFDLNIVIRLPTGNKTFYIESDYPGYTKILLESFPYNSKFTIKENNKLQKLISNGYLNQYSFRHWIESVIIKALNLHATSQYDECTLNLGMDEKCSVKVKKSGPAFTIILNTLDPQEINVDLVPVLAFNYKFPTDNEIATTCRIKEWLVVPKPLNKFVVYEERELYWRLCFYEQEKEILAKFGQIKPVIMQIKKLRDTQGWKCIASYYIETLFLHQIMACAQIRTLPKTVLLVMMMERLRDACKYHKIDYFWDPNYNLLEGLNADATHHISNRLAKIISCITKSIEINPYAIYTYILTPEEYEMLQCFISEKNNTSSETDESIDVEAEESTRAICQIL